MQLITNVFVAGQKDAVTIRLLVDLSFATRSFSEFLDLLGLALEFADRFCKLKADNQPLDTEM